MKRVTTFFIAAALAASTSAAFAGGHGGNPAVKARQSHMQLYAHNLGILGGMARGNIEYDAGAAQAAANNLAALSTLDQRSYWVPGTSNAELGEATRALPALWEAVQLHAKSVDNSPKPRRRLQQSRATGKARSGPHSAQWAHLVVRATKRIGARTTESRKKTWHRTHSGALKADAPVPRLSRLTDRRSGGRGSLDDKTH